MKFGLYLVEHGMITTDQFVKALEVQLASRPLIGALAIETGKLSVKQVFSILRTQADMPHEMFGALAIQAGFLTKIDLDALLYEQSVRGTPMPQILGELEFAEAGDLEEQFAEFSFACGGADKKEPVPA
ncbi:MAG: hypothetical protein GXP28_00070 [Planctomycetes bacterium]|nr:hypothetical protein [Planctomycetota bacterium]